MIASFEIQTQWSAVYLSHNFLIAVIFTKDVIFIPTDFQYY